MSRGSRLKSGFSLGGEAAEADGLLEYAFVESGDYSTIASKTDHKCLLVGRTGAGKSALLKRIHEVNPDHCIRISPENLSLPYITNLQAIRYLDSLDVNLDTFWQTLWRHVLLVEILKHRYKVNSPAAKVNFFESLRSKLQTDRTKQAALDYLNEFEGRFWCETDERVREITDKFADRITAEASGVFGVPGAGASLGTSFNHEASSEAKFEQVARFQRVVNDTQLARLNKMIDVLDDDILDSPHNFTYVVIDDLDKEWVDERIANDLIRCLFSTVYSLQHVRNLKIVVALRTNIFQELDFGKRGGGQEEKFRALVLDMKWTKASLNEMLDERTRVASGRVGLPINSFREFLPNQNATMGKPTDYILERTLLRPRDALAFANECFKVGAGKDRLAWADIKTAEVAYSAGRVLALRDEWKGTYPGIGDVLEKFRRSSMRMNREEFQSRLDDVMLLLSEADFEGAGWLEKASSRMWSADGSSAWEDVYQPLISVLYRMGFVGIGPAGRTAPVFHPEDSLFAEQKSNLKKAPYFYLHRAYQSGLESQPAAQVRGR